MIVMVLSHGEGEDQLSSTQHLQLISAFLKTIQLISLPLQLGMFVCSRILKFILQLTTDFTFTQYVYDLLSTADR